MGLLAQNLHEVRIGSTSPDFSRENLPSHLGLGLLAQKSYIRHVSMSGMGSTSPQIFT